MPDACDGTPSSPPSAEDDNPGEIRGPGWVAKSDGYARPILDLAADFEPENFAPLGVPGAEEKITRLPPDWPQDKLTAYDQAIRTLGESRAHEGHAAVRLDLESMITYLGWELDYRRIDCELMLPCPNLAHIVAQGLLSLLTDRTRKKSRTAAVPRRLRRYAGLEEGYLPLAQQAETLIRARLDRSRLLGPWRDRLLQDLHSGPRLLAELPRLFAAEGVTGHERALDKMQRQFATYGRFLHRSVLPRCRRDFRLPPELYAARLKRLGVELSIPELSHRAEAAFGEIRRQLEASARRLASQRGWRDVDFPGVLHRLMQDRLDPSEILAHYARRHLQLEEVIATTRLVSLPRSRRFNVRLASEAENAMLPFPHFRWPRHFDNRSEAGEIVLPLISPQDRSADLQGDAYASRAVSWPVAAHEGFPGHALQIGRLLEPDISLARGPLAFNDAGLEGWAAYAESEIAPDLPLEARCLTLRSKLCRAAGAFLDPGLQQGRFTLEQARRFLQGQVGLSEREAGQALWRYISWSPGQATTYFCGQLQLAALRTAVECCQGPAFDRREYHDFLLAQGLLPLSLLRRWVLEHHGPERQLAA